MKTVYQDENNVVLDENNVECKLFKAVLNELNNEFAYLRRIRLRSVTINLYFSTGVDLCFSVQKLERFHQILVGYTLRIWYTC